MLNFTNDVHLMSTFSNDLSVGNEAGVWTSVHTIPTEIVLVSVSKEAYYK
jgi:hypothetical protein